MVLCEAFESLGLEFIQAEKYGVLSSFFQHTIGSLLFALQLVSTYE